MPSKVAYSPGLNRMIKRCQHQDLCLLLVALQQFLRSDYKAEHGFVEIFL